MAVDLFSAAGLPIFFDLNTGLLNADSELSLYPVHRPGGELRRVLRHPDTAPDQEPVYTLWFPGDDSPAGRQLAADRLHYCLVVVPPRLFGDEYIKTYGHYHEPMGPGLPEWPEVYTVLHGEGFFLLQLAGPDGHANRSVVLHLKAPSHFLIPPGWGHCAVNPTTEPLVFAGLYGRQTTNRRDEYDERVGAAAYVLCTPSGPSVVPNPRYNLPAPPIVTDPAGTPFYWPDPLPIWTQYLNHSETFDFLRNPAAARQLCSR